MHTAVSRSVEVIMRVLALPATQEGQLMFIAVEWVTFAVSNGKIISVDRGDDNVESNTVLILFVFREVVRDGGISDVLISDAEIVITSDAMVT